MRETITVKALLIGLSMFGVSITVAVVVVVVLATGDGAPAFPEAGDNDRAVVGKDDESSRSETGPITNTPGAGGEEPTPPEASPPEIDDPPNSAELSDLQAIADQKGISLQEAINRYGWHGNFALAVSRIRATAPGTYAGAEIVDGAHAWIGFTGHPPKAALDILELFTSSHGHVSVEVRIDLEFSEAELEKAIPAVHYAVLKASGVLDASTSFDSGTGQIRTIVVLESTASDSRLDDLRTIATKRLIDVTRPDILDSITISVVRSKGPILGGDDSKTR